MKKKRIDLIFCQVNKHKVNMPFENFLVALVKLAEFKYPQYSSGEALKAIVRGYMMPLHQKITNSN